MTALLLLATLGCAPSTHDVALRLPEPGALVVTRTARSITRTPLGPENLEIKSTKRYEVLSGGRVGVDLLHWREEYTRYEVAWDTREYALKWSLGRDEEGYQEPLPAPMVPLGPHPPREVWVHPDRRIEVRMLPWPEPDPPAEEEPRGGQLVKGKPVVEAPLEPEPEPEPPPIVPATLDDIDNFVAGLLLAPSEPTHVGTTWQWSTSERVTQGGEVSNTTAWKLDRMAGAEAVLVETLSLSKASAPARDEFRTTSLTGSGEMRLDTRTGLPVSYTSMFEAGLASPSARGSSTMKVEAKFRWKAP